jgi:signal transduction histidine kinase
MVVMGPIAWAFTDRITRPLRRFADAADRLGRDPQGEGLPLDGPAEVGLAARAFNGMQKRLQKYVADRVTMTGAISHDLRTPLTRIRFQVENAPPKLRDAVLKDVAQMEAMITAALAFIRDADQRFDREKLDLTTLLACAVDDRQVAGDLASFDENSPNAVIEGDPIALRRLFDNLVDNAIKYGKVAHVTLEKIGGDAVVTIRDEGPGLSTGDLERVFTPFYRTQAAREQHFDGTGLGLAIVRSVARAHGGDVQLSRERTGLAARVTLPLIVE